MNANDRTKMTFSFDENAIYGNYACKTTLKILNSSKRSRKLFYYVFAFFKSIDRLIYNLKLELYEIVHKLVAALLVAQ